VHARQALHFTVVLMIHQLFPPHSSGMPGAAGGSGTGKSTTLRLMAGLLEPDSGQVVVQARYVFQHADDLCVAVLQSGRPDAKRC